MSVLMSAPVYDFSKLGYNPHAGQCDACGLYLDQPETGQFVENPFRFLCLSCIGGIEERLAGFPLQSESGPLTLMPFQVDDVRRVGRERALLIGSQMGTGKTIVASVGALKANVPNFVFCPSSVKRNWQREIRKWRPDLVPVVVDSQALFGAMIGEHVKTPGSVLIASYGLLPGGACKGCNAINRKIRALKKQGKSQDPGVTQCVHTSEAMPHPKTGIFNVDGRPREIEYHEGCEGCWQTSPIPEFKGPVVLLADECHAFKTPSAQRTRKWRRLKDAVWAAGGYVYGLSGTPCEGKPQEFWEVLVSFGLNKRAFLDPGKTDDGWTNYYQIFHEWYENPKGGRIPPKGALKDELHMRLKKVQLNRRRKDVLDQLPPRIEEVIEVEMDEQTAKAVNEAVHRMIAVRKALEDTQSGMSFMRALPKLEDPYQHGLNDAEKGRRKALFDERVELYFKERPWDTDEEIAEAVESAMSSVADMPTIHELSRIRAMLSQAKVAAVTQWIEDRAEEEEPVVLFSQHVSILKKLANRPGWACFHGGLTAKKRDQLVQEFQAGKYSGLAVSIGAGGEGITLTYARVCAFIDLNWNPAKNAQSESRLIRIGSEHHDSIVVVRFVAKHCVDRLVIETLEEKMELLEALEWDEGEAA